MRVAIRWLAIPETKACSNKIDDVGKTDLLLIKDQCYQNYRKLEELHANNSGTKTRMQPQRNIYPAIFLLCLPVIGTPLPAASCILSESFNATSPK